MDVKIGKISFSYSNNLENSHFKLKWTVGEQGGVDLPPSDEKYPIVPKNIYF